MYYYFSSTLPLLFFDGNMPFSVEDFCAECERLLVKRDYQDARIALGLEEAAAHNAMLKEWQRFDRALRNEIVVLRAPQVKKNAAVEMRGEREFDGEVAQVLAQVSKMENLLEAEKSIMHMQWRKLDEFSLNKNFETDFILAYALKLKMLERLNAFKTDDGAKKLEEIMELASHGEAKVQ